MILRDDSLLHVYSTLYNNATRRNKKRGDKVYVKGEKGGNEMWDKLRSYDYDDEQGGKEKAKG